VIESAGPAGATLLVLQQARIYECLPLQCPRCGEPIRIIAFVLDPPVIERMWNRCAIPPAAITLHVGEPVEPPAILPARSPPQGEIQFNQTASTDEWPEMDQTTGEGGDTWE
jgi:hypothetical protein